MGKQGGRGKERESRPRGRCSVFLNRCFPVGPVVKTPQYSQYMGTGSIPGLGTKVPHGAAKVNKQNRKLYCKTIFLSTYEHIILKIKFI